MTHDVRAERVSHLIDHLGHLLPVQGPISVFIHHNTLHAFEHLPFEDAVKEASRIYGTEPYMTEEAFRRHFENGRITAEDVEEVLSWEPNPGILPHLLDRRSFRKAFLVHGIPMRNAGDISWWLAEGSLSAPRRALFETCLNLTLAPAVETEETPGAVPEVDALLIRLSAAYLDQGISHWAMPGRRHGFLTDVRSMLMWSGLAEPFPGLAEEMRRQWREKLSAVQAIEQMLDRLGISAGEEESFLRTEMLALAGWAGMFRRLEKEPQLVPHEPIPSSLMEFVAVRLTLRAFAPAAMECSASGPEDQQKQRRLEAAAALFHAAEALSMRSADLESLGRANLESLRREVQAFDHFERRRIWHSAYELRHEKIVLAPLAARMERGIPPQSKARPRAQVFFCIDDREESMRRMIEEIEPSIETFAAAGFYGVAMNYSGIDDAFGVSLCPIVVTPQHAVREQPVPEHVDLHERRKALRRVWSQWAHNARHSSRVLSLGWLSTAVLGVFSIFPLLVRVLAPRRYGQLLQKLNELFLPEPRTEVTLVRTDEHSHDLDEGLVLGFTEAEKIDRVESVLRPAGLTRNFARLVVMLGHGSTSLNNPHESAYDCGACGGRNGGPNGRLFAAMANIPAVREGLRKRGIDIPGDTWFIGGLHDTASDEIALADLDAVPETHRGEFVSLREILDRARAANALERCRRFESADGVKTPQAALEHVENRAEHLAEPRTECGHATNAVAFVGRRLLTRGLFLDRRWFLISYDAAQDPDNESLTRLLVAGGPVCAGISLEYYFSYVDNQRLGCGTKLPHNVTGLLGVMDGHASDLRTGLPWQMVEIHEPVRCLFIVETSPERLTETVKRLPAVEQLVAKNWVRVATVDPETRQVSVLRPWGFERFRASGESIPRALSSRDWYRGQRDHLLPAEISGLAGAA